MHVHTGRIILETIEPFIILLEFTIWILLKNLKIHILLVVYDV